MTEALGKIREVPKIQSFEAANTDIDVIEHGQKFDLIKKRYVDLLRKVKKIRNSGEKITRNESKIAYDIFDEVMNFKTNFGIEEVDGTIKMMLRQLNKIIEKFDD